MLRKAALPSMLAVTALVVALGLTACGGSSPSSSNTASRSAHKNAGLKLAECMRSHGVPQFPDPSNGGGFGIEASPGGGTASISVDGHTLNVSGPAFQKAMQRCRGVAPQGPPISGAQLARIKHGALKMAQCMRRHGVPNFPDPRVTTGPGGHGIAVAIGGPAGSGSTPRDFNPRSPAFQNAQKACGGILGQIGPSPAQKAAG